MSWRDPETVGAMVGKDGRAVGGPVSYRGSQHHWPRD